MRLLLDTCTFLWIVRDTSDLSATARRLFEDPDNEVYLSVVSAWEITVKHALGRLPLADPPRDYVPRERARHGIAPLPLTERDALHLETLPAIHQDPFDRMLICQAKANDLALLTPDSRIRTYPIASLW